MGYNRGRRVNPEDRAESILLIQEAIQSGARKIKACETLETNIRTIERWEKNPRDRRRGPLNRPSNALSSAEREMVLTVANSEEYANLPPSQIVPRLADNGRYIASESSFHRILKENKLLAHRQKSKPSNRTKPDEFSSTKPNQVWSWDITYLKAGIKGTYYYLYLPMDVFSRKIVHWELHENESAENASKMITKACLIEGVQNNQLVLHSDNGGPMKGATMLATLQRLGVAPSFSRPSVSNDNPFSESLFKTLKYCPSFPERGFASIDDAKAWVIKFVNWYNNTHLHSGINFVTPSSKHRGEDKEILKNRHEVYRRAKIKNPERWSKNTRNWSPTIKVELNPKKHKENQAA